MQLRIDQPLLALEPGQVVTLDDAAGTRVSARYGAIWVTEEGSEKDHIVRPGEDFVLRRRGRTVVQALQPAWVALQ
jgi:hypothetical protein